MESSAATGEVVKSITAELSEEAAIIFALSNSSFHKNFLERFLGATGRLLRLPWWAVHLAFYLGVSLAFVYLLNVNRLYPKAGYVSFGAEQVGEFIFTTFMLWHLRRSRSAAVLAAARITDGKNRLIWLRKYLAPASWGWVARLGNREWNIRVWFVSAVLLTAYWGSQLIYYRGGWLRVPHSQYYWAIYYPYPQLLYIYPTIAKAAMMVAGAAHFWWLYGLMSLVRGRCPSGLTIRQRRSLYLECGRAATQFSLGVSAATVVWVSARALAYGFSFWAYLYSFCLLLVFAGEVVIITDAKFPWISAQFLRQLIAPDFAIEWQVAATLSAVWGLILGLGPMAHIVGASSKF